ncbi:MAG: glycerophosphoryl diester phosphodiesterase, partial [Chloroflexota bacterium]|nr:glycerophosphoryl diester phosphodiesterase [Chloroflexota bacterium]
MLILAHRGASGYAPENTFAAFDVAVSMGADGVETDVQLTGDGALVLLHDDTVDRTTDGHGLLVELTLEQVSRLDAGHWYGELFGGERIPTLEAFLERYVGVLRLDLEIK